MLYSRSCNVRKDAQIKSHVQRFRWMVPLRCEVGSRIESDLCGRI